MIELKTISAISQLIPGWKAKHPLVAVIDFSKYDEQLPAGTAISSSFYTVMYKNYCSNTLRYGRQRFDFQEGSLICIAPNQVLTLDTEVEKKENMVGWGLFFHPDLIRQTSMGSKMKEYSFFSYDVSEALHLSDKEEKVLLDCIHNIENELQENIDRHSQTLIVSNIELFLNYCARYYGRQFITRKPANNSVVSQVDRVLQQQFGSGILQEKGLPTVGYLSGHIHLSPGYLSDLLKTETGLTAQEYIHAFLIEEAKKALVNSDNTVSEIAYSLGFEYPQYFSRLFKQKTGKTPQEYRMEE